MADDELRVRQLAYRIWESEGRPDGQQRRHWDMALKIVAAEQAKGNGAWLEEEGETHDEAPIFEDDLPLEDDEVGIQENRLPLDEPEAETPPEEVPYRDDVMAEDDVPVQDRGHDNPSTLDGLPEDSATVSRTEHPRRIEDTVTSPDPTDTSQVPGKRAATGTRAKRTTASKSSTTKSGAGKSAATKAGSTRGAGKEATGKGGTSGKASKSSSRSGTRKTKT